MNNNSRDYAAVGRPSHPAVVAVPRPPLCFGMVEYEYDPLRESRIGILLIIDVAA